MSRRPAFSLVACFVLLSLVALVAARPGAAAVPTLYVGDGKGYSVAFKGEAGSVYAMQLAGATNCYYTEPHDDVGESGFSVFSAPKLMRAGPKGFVAEESFSISMWGGGYARVRAEFAGDMVTGDFSFDESEESFHCDTGLAPVPFEAERYVPAASPEEGQPRAGEIPAYYGSDGGIEIFLRATGKEAGGIRGTFAPRCPVGRERSVTGSRHALFSRPGFAKRGKKGRFSRRVVHEGRIRSGPRFEERISVSGRVTANEVSGAYRRVRITSPGKPSAQRCATGPIPFQAVRHLPAG